jgi:hypothetical protein
MPRSAFPHLLGQVRREGEHHIRGAVGAGGDPFVERGQARVVRPFRAVEDVAVHEEAERNAEATRADMSRAVGVGEDEVDVRQRTQDAIHAAAEEHFVRNVAEAPQRVEVGHRHAGFLRPIDIAGKGVRHERDLRVAGDLARLPQGDRGYGAGGAEGTANDGNVHRLTASQRTSNQQPVTCSPCFMSH